MKVSIDDVELFTISDTQRKIICDYLKEEIFEEDMKRRIKWIVDEITKNAFDQLKNRWMPVLEQEHDSIPTNKEALAELIFARSDYLNRSQRQALNSAESS